jgi:hypothetical protein
MLSHAVKRHCGLQMSFLVKTGEGTEQTMEGDYSSPAPKATLTTSGTSPSVKVKVCGPRTDATVEGPLKAASLAANDGDLVGGDF